MTDELVDRDIGLAGRGDFFADDVFRVNALDKDTGGKGDGGHFQDGSEEEESEEGSDDNDKVASGHHAEPHSALENHVRETKEIHDEVILSDHAKEKVKEEGDDVESSLPDQALDETADLQTIEQTSSENICSRNNSFNITA